MAIQKKSLITNLSATKKAVTASHSATPASTPATLSPRGISMKAPAKNFKAAGNRSLKGSSMRSFKSAGNKSLKGAGARFKASM